MYREISVFIPVYNSASFIKDSVSIIYDYLHQNFDNFELIIIDDNSSDHTVNILYSIIEEKKYIRLIENKAGPSRRENLGKAICEAQYKIAMFFDADISVPLSFVSTAFDNIQVNDYDIAIGSRYKGIKAQRSLKRLLYSKIFNSFLRITFKSNVQDHICGFKAFKTDHFKNLHNQLGYDYSYKRGWFWDAELLIIAQKNNFKISEIPVQWTAAKESSFDFLREIKMLSYIWKNYMRIKE